MKIVIATAGLLIWMSVGAQAQVGSGGFPPLNSRPNSIASEKSNPVRTPQLQLATTPVFSGSLQRAPWAAWKEDDEEP